MPGMAAGESISQAFSVAASKAFATSAAKAKAKAKADVAGEKKTKPRPAATSGYASLRTFRRVSLPPTSDAGPVPSNRGSMGPGT